MISRGRDRSLYAASLRGVQGVTLIELVVALSLLALTVGSIYALVGVGGRSARTTNDFLQTQAHVRAALDNVVDEIRWAQGVSCASATVVTLSIPQDTPFSLTSPYRVTFAHDASAQTLTRREDPAGSGCPDSASGRPIAYFIGRAGEPDGLAFEYFGADGTSLGTTPTDLASIARVRITVTAVRDQVRRTFAGDAALRAR